MQSVHCVLSFLTLDKDKCKVSNQEWRKQSKHCWQGETFLTFFGPFDLTVHLSRPSDCSNPHKIIGIIALKVTGNVTMTRHIRQLVTPAPDREAGGSLCTWSRWSLAWGFLQSHTSGQHLSNPRPSLRCSPPPLHAEGLGRRRRIRISFVELRQMIGKGMV